jgi:hypothetical protein
MRLFLAGLLISVITLSTLMLFGWWSAVALPVTLGMVAYIRLSTSMRYAYLVFAVFVLVLCLSIVVALAPESREACMRSSCCNKLKQIGVALHTYRTKYGEFPPSAIRDSHNQALLSWRVLLLPMLGEERTYKELDLKQGWNSEKNRRATTAPLAGYRCLNDAASERPAITSYVAITGPGAAWPPDRPASESHLPDTFAGTILLIECPDSDIGWAEPRDVTIDELFARDSKIRASLKHAHSGGFCALFGDGDVHLISDDIPDDILRALLAVDHVKPVDRAKDFIGWAATPWHTACWKGIALLAWLLSLGIALLGRSKVVDYRDGDVLPKTAVR